jgi:Ni,Fe-hydrogenase I small subunit
MAEGKRNGRFAYALQVSTAGTVLGSLQSERYDMLIWKCRAWNVLVWVTNLDCTLCVSSFQNGTSVAIVRFEVLRVGSTFRNDAL